MPSKQFLCGEIGCGDGMQHIGKWILSKQFGWIPATLGKRIYRMETAAVAAAILILYEFER